MKLYSEAYENYLISHNQWSDHLPSEWDEKRVKDLFRLVTDMAPDDNNFELLSLYASIGVRPRKDLEARGNKASSTDGYWLVKKGDIVVNKLLAWMGAIGLSDYDGVTSPAYDVLRKYNSMVDERYFAYLFRTEKAQEIFKKHSRGIMDMRLRLYFDKFGAITVPVPPLLTQQAIAAYLDTKTAQIDRRIDLLSQKATQYGQLKQALINETVTRGLDKTVQMKDSGVEWIGEVPAHWEVTRGKDAFKQTKNKVGIESSSYDVLSLTLKGVIKRDLDSMKGKIPASFDGYQIANPDNLVLCLFDMDVTPRIVGYVEQLGIITSAYTVLEGKPDTCMKYFLYYYLEQNRNGSLLANSKTLRSTMTFDLFSLLQIPFPPFLEQQAIATYLDEKTAHIDRIIATIQTQIDKLKELRKTLINDVVTGKIRVVTEGQTP